MVRTGLRREQSRIRASLGLAAEFCGHARLRAVSHLQAVSSSTHKPGYRAHGSCRFPADSWSDPPHRQPARPGTFVLTSHQLAESVFSPQPFAPCPPSPSFLILSVLSLSKHLSDPAIF